MVELLACGREVLMGETDQANLDLGINSQTL